MTPCNITHSIVAMNTKAKILHHNRLDANGFFFSKTLKAN